MDAETSAPETVAWAAGDDKGALFSLHHTSIGARAQVRFLDSTTEETSHVVAPLVRLSDYESLSRALSAMTEERDAARRDSERLDWMQANRAFVSHGNDTVGKPVYEFFVASQMENPTRYVRGATLREAIDAARGRDQGGQ